MARADRARRLRIPTGELNQFFRRFLEQPKVATSANSRLKVLYLTQAGIGRQPSFSLPAAQGETAFLVRTVSCQSPARVLRFLGESNSNPAAQPGKRHKERLMSESVLSIEAVDGEARAGRLATSHGEIETPVFMPVGTQGTVKAQTQEMLEALGAQIILSNTYHLFCGQGMTIAELGGLHQFLAGIGAILTDSGGFRSSASGT